MVDTAETDIAVIGMSCRFPGANNPSSFWRNLIEGRESITFFSREELAAAGLDSSLYDHQSYVRARGVLDNIDSFDAAAFDMTPSEAAMTDPQHRLFLECAWEAMEDGGYDGSNYRGPVGVYGGSGANSYLRDNVLPVSHKDDLAGLYQVMQANEKDFLATKTAYKLNLTGPAITVQTACSTSLVAVHCGCQAILNGECDMALAGGVSIFLPQICGYRYQEGMILSPDGHCRAFDASASGTVMGSGAGVVLMKRLEDALEDRDYIYGVIKGGAVNNDGAGKVGFSAPGVEGQITVIREALAVSGVYPSEIGYVEAHGTATPMGDPVEIEALRRAFGKKSQFQNECFIGSVKTNIGHCDAASGIAGFIKTLLTLKNGIIPPSLHYEKPNPAINFEDTPFKVCTRPTNWEARSGPRLAGVSSFGMGGTNAHVIVQQAPDRKKTASRRSFSLLPISAKTVTAVTASAHQLGGDIEAHPEKEMQNIAFSLQVGRRPLNNRIFYIGSNRNEVTKALSESHDVDRLRICTLDGRMSPVITFMFPGQGSQYVGMGRELYVTEKVFRANIDYCAEILIPVLGLDLRNYINTRDNSLAEELQQTSIAQPVLFSVEYAYAMLLAEWGIHPKSMIGHSLGEYVAACMAGIFNLPDALRLVAARGALMQRQPKGLMVAVALAPQEVVPFLSKEVSLAADNGSSCTVSGPSAAVHDFIGLCSSEGIAHTVLKTSHAFHSAMFDEAMDEFAAIVKDIPREVPRIEILSNLTGHRLSDHEAVDPWYWARHLRHTVRFNDGLDALLTAPGRLLLEVGPGNTLAGIAMRDRSLEENQHIIGVGCHPRDETGCDRALFSAIGKMWTFGVKVDWQAFNEHDDVRRIPLPTYPFEREVHWMAAVQKSTSVSEDKPQLLPADEWLFTAAWRRLSQRERGSSHNHRDQWIVISNSGQGSDAVIRGLKTRGVQLSVVTPAEKFCDHVDGNISADVSDPEHLGQLLHTFTDAKKLSIVHIPSLHNQSSSIIWDEQTIRFTIALAQALDTHKRNGQVFCDILTHGIYDITGDERLIPAHAAYVAIAQSLSREYPAFHCRCIDCGIEDTHALWSDTRVEMLVNELMTAERKQTIALRGGYRWQQYYESVSHAAPDVVFRDRGTYLITGGLGDIGLALADYISRQCNANLILTRKSYFPEQDGWDAWLAEHENNNQTSVIISRLMTMLERGTAVMAVSADVSSQQEMQTLLAGAENRFGRIDGCIHAAGVTGADALCSYRDMTVEKFRMISSPKLDGYRILRDIMADREPDFLIAMSSLSAILGGTGMGAYGAANAIMATQITSDNRTDDRWLCIDWDGWRFNELSTELSEDSSGENDSVRYAIPAAVGAEQLARLALARCTDRVAVSTTDLTPRLHWWSPDRVEPGSLGCAGNTDNQRSVVQKLNDPEEEFVAEIWRIVLGAPVTDGDESFFTLGGNSLQLTQVHSRLKESLGVEFPLRSLFEAPRLADMAALVRQHMVQPEVGFTPPREEMEF
ncbi:type I polyketide synthase [Desulfosediminicola flagellatus]|uniref:type I polyketide synthase n=1 Tax=Desulfosediminicola flagellatus TaxID=2569541 RepID=UPI0010AC4530|nr:type I polyketide synthase [Desulfosediminicola flagellatus]